MSEAFKKECHDDLTFNISYQARNPPNFIIQISLMCYEACKIQILTAEISILGHLMGKRRAFDVFP
jgi:hypothetical protein